MLEYVYEKPALGTSVSVAIITADKNQADKSASFVFAEVAKYEKTFSRFLPDSELSRLNQVGQMTVSPLFFEVFMEAVKAYKISQGYFNPLLQVAQLGYDKDFKAIKNQTKEITDLSYNTDFTSIKIDEKTRTIALQTYQALDFGGFLKGYLAAKLADELMERQSAAQGVIVNLGGDIAVRGFDQNNLPFTLSVYNPISDTDTHLLVKNESLSTSGIYKRSWQTRQGKRHHILDKTTLDNPNTNIISASALYPDGTKSEVYAKLLLLLPLNDALTIINENNLKYLTIDKDDNVNKNI